MVRTLWAVIAGVPDPAPSAPAGLAAKATVALALIKWGSLIVAAAVLMGAGMMVLAGDHGRGAGLSPEMKKNVGNVVVALILVGAAAGIVDFFST